MVSALTGHLRKTRGRRLRRPASRGRRHRSRDRTSSSAPKRAGRRCFPHGGAARPPLHRQPRKASRAAKGTAGRQHCGRGGPGDEPPVGDARPASCRDASSAFEHGGAESPDMTTRGQAASSIRTGEQSNPTARQERFHLPPHTGRPHTPRPCIDACSIVVATVVLDETSTSVPAGCGHSLSHCATAWRGSYNGSGTVGTGWSWELWEGSYNGSGTVARAGLLC